MGTENHLPFGCSNAAARQTERLRATARRQFVSDMKETPGTYRRRMFRARLWILIVLLVAAAFAVGVFAGAAGVCYINCAFPGAPVGVAVVALYNTDGSGRRSDAVRLLAAGPGGISETAVPRDSLFTLPGRRPEKLTDLFAHIGPLATTRLLAETYHIPLCRYVVLNQATLADAVDAVGGIPANLDAPIHFRDWQTHRPVYIPAGKQVLTGWQFVQAARQRGEGGDTGDRIPRQTRLVRALAKAITERLPSNPALLSRLSDRLSRIPTNMSARERALLLLRGCEGLSRTLDLRPPGTNENNRFRLDLDGAHELGNQLLDRSAGRSHRPGLVIRCSRPEQAETVRPDAVDAGFTVLSTPVVIPAPDASFIAAPHAVLAQSLRLADRLHRTDRVVAIPPGRRNYAVLTLGADWRQLK